MDSKSDLSSLVTIGGSISGTFKLNEKVAMPVVAVMGGILIYVAAKKLIRGRRSHWTGVGGVVQGGIELVGRRSHWTGVGGVVQGGIELGGRRNHGTGSGGVVQGGIELGGRRNHGTGSGGVVQGGIELGGNFHENDAEIDMETGEELSGAAPE
ncbi:hypothetical protein V6N13_065184 [Hibiscus sabdariffa]|uniref:Uncharacterized protein n=1 Tax=Hibiscus sabdariffa TaxID=183260 RepID=A0ABR2QRK7_9ROSI